MKWLIKGGTKRGKNPIEFAEIEYTVKGEEL